MQIGAPKNANENVMRINMTNTIYKITYCKNIANLFTIYSYISNIVIVVYFDLE